VQRVGASIIVNPDTLGPGWRLSENTLLYELKDALDGMDEGRRRRKPSPEYADASDALVKAVGLLKGTGTVGVPASWVQQTWVRTR
jgi:hypothetical protein